MSARLNIAQSRVRALVVDDSKAMCHYFCSVLASDPDIEVIGFALDAFEAREKIKQYKPDVITLDVEMPRMNGLTFLRNLMRLHPMPVVMLSSLTTEGAEVTLDALDSGAVDFVVKRQASSDQEMEEYRADLIQRVKQAGRMSRATKADNIAEEGNGIIDMSGLRCKLKSSHRAHSSLKKVIAVGASTGGPDAFRHLLSTLNAPDCALIIAQHMPQRYMESFASRLNMWASFDICVATQGARLVPGKGYVAPGDQHLEIIRKDGELNCHVHAKDPVCGHRPSVEVMFKSVAKTVGSGALGLLMTGMGDDGAQGLKDMRTSGSLTIVQDEMTSAVWGMPGIAFRLEAADAVLPLRQLGPAITGLLAKS